VSDDASDTGEQPETHTLLAYLPVTFAKRRTVDAGNFGGPPAGTTTATPMRLSRGPSLSAIGAYRKWSSDAQLAGFPVGGMAMVLGLTEHHLAVYSSKFLRSRPKNRAGMVPLSDIVQMTAVRSLLSSRVVVLLTNGSIVELETMRMGRARRFVAQVLEQRARN
jgi:hypothetical protein